jgi:hypothetical protein
MVKSNKKPWITAAELSRQLETDPEFVIRRQQREKEQQERSVRIYAETLPLLTELRAAGLNIQSVSDLISRSERYETAIPILLKHLVMPYSDVARETIARSLAVPEPEVRKAWPTLVEQYRKAPMGEGIRAPGDTKNLKLSAKHGLAVALSVAVTEATLTELIGLANDRKNGESRILLLSALRKSKSTAAKQAIEQLALDPELEKEIASWRKRK